MMRKKKSFYTDNQDDNFPSEEKLKAYMQRYELHTTSAAIKSLLDDNEHLNAQKAMQVTAEERYEKMVKDELKPIKHKLNQMDTNQRILLVIIHGLLIAYGLDNIPIVEPEIGPIVSAEHLVRKLKNEE